MSGVQEQERDGSVPSRFYCGMEVFAVPDLEEVLEDMHQSHMDFICVPLVHPRYHRNLLPDGPKRREPLTRSDLLLNSSQWSTYVVGKISPWLDLDSRHGTIRKNSEQALAQELAWAAHLSVPAILLPTPAFECVNYARCVYNFILTSYVKYDIWIRVPFMEPESEGQSTEDPWECWNRFRSMCNQSAHVSIALEFTTTLPSTSVVDKWLGEPVKGVIIPTSVFVPNKKGYPVLLRKYQQVLARFFKHKLQYILKGKPRHPHGMAAYQKYLDHLFHAQPPMTPQEQFESPFYDYLQTPLQPLMDNLDSATYETFEQDPVKYAQYEEAVYCALLERASPNIPMVIMVVGAGRGPLVRASLRAAARSQRLVKVYALDKNPNVVVTLQNMKTAEGWGDAVEVVNSDMRDWMPPEQADILVSELLGSFGDNELSPECLDGAQRYLKASGISIPCEYTSYVAPISSSKNWNDVRARNDATHFETSYVVRLHNFTQLAPSKPCFTFVHPNKDGTPDNERYTVLSFEGKESAILHGFAGFFDAKLYGNIHISINPQTFSTGMFSWFPIFFPIHTPVYVPENSVVECHFWRRVQKHKVWYEWAVTKPSVVAVHNAGGRSHWIGL